MTAAMLADIIDGPMAPLLRQPRGKSAAQRAAASRRAKCRAKVDYTTATLAQHEAQRLEMSVYRCALCGYWHLTSHPQPQEEAS